METTSSINKSTKGGEFLIRTTSAEDIFIPEEWTEEQLMIAQTCREFLEQEVYPNLDRIDAQVPIRKGQPMPVEVVAVRSRKPRPREDVGEQLAHGPPPPTPYQRRGAPRQRVQARRSMRALANSSVPREPPRSRVF